MKNLLYERYIVIVCKHLKKNIDHTKWYICNGCICMFVCVPCMLCLLYHIIEQTMELFTLKGMLREMERRKEAE